MNLKHLEFFVCLAKTEHMAKAAEMLGISQPSLSYAINSLEDELGVPLFEKSGRNIKLTNYGKIYLQYVKRSLHELENGENYISELLDVNRGHINLGFTFTMGQDLVPRLVYEFNKYPQNKSVNFSFNQGTTAELLQQLLDDKLDLVFASEPPADLRPELNVKHLVDQELLAAVPPESILAKRDEITLEELANEPFILYAKNSGLRQNIDTIFQNANVTPKVRLEATEDHTIIGFVHWGFGVALVPNLPQLAKNEVKLLKIKEINAKHPLFAITKSNHFLTPSISHFQDFIHDYCKKNYLQTGKTI